jgi:hypothetical protein
MTTVIDTRHYGGTLTREIKNPVVIYEGRTPDLMAALEEALGNLRAMRIVIHIHDEALAQVDPGALVDDLLAWAFRQAPDADRAERIEREAWGDNPVN